MQDLTLRFETPEQRGSFVQWLRDNQAELTESETTRFNTIDFNLDLGSVIFTNQAKREDEKAPEKAVSATAETGSSTGTTTSTDKKKTTK